MDDSHRRLVCTGLAQLLRQYAPKNSRVIDLIRLNSDLLDAERIALIAYFGAEKLVQDL